MSVGAPPTLSPSPAPGPGHAPGQSPPAHSRHFLSGPGRVRSVRRGDPGSALGCGPDLAVSAEQRTLMWAAADGTVSAASWVLALGMGAGGRCGVVARQRCRRPRPSALGGEGRPGEQVAWLPHAPRGCSASLSASAGRRWVRLGSRILTPLRLPGQVLSLPSAPATLGKSARFTRP